MPDYFFQGARTTGDWQAADRRPKDWRDEVLLYHPNGMAPLTALTALMGNVPTSSPEYNWWEKRYAHRGGDIDGVFTNATLVTAYVSGGTKGDVVYVQMSALDIAKVRARNVVLLFDASLQDMVVRGKVTSIVVDGADSYMVVTLMEDDDNGATTDLSDADKWFVMGSVNEELSGLPEQIVRESFKRTNYTQIFMEAITVSRTAQKEQTRAEQAYENAYKEAHLAMQENIEKSFLFGVPHEGVGANGHPERMTGGLMHFIQTYSSHIYDYPTDESGVAWATGGYYWLLDKLADICSHGSGNRLAYCDNAALVNLMRALDNRGEFRLEQTQDSFGFQYTEVTSPFGKLMLKTHPLFNVMPFMTNRLMLFDPELIRLRTIDDVTHITDPHELKAKSGSSFVDGTIEGFVGEVGLEINGAEDCAILSGFGVDG